MVQSSIQGVAILAEKTARQEEILTPEATRFVADLQRQFRSTRFSLLEQRRERQTMFDRGEDPGFLPETKSIRESAWMVAPPPADLRDRRVEITGPTDAKMVINALNSGARVFMADFEDANTPTWENLIEGHANLIEAIERTISFESPEGKQYQLKEDIATLMVRPRGWHLIEKHFLVDGEPVSASLFDFGLYFFHNAKRLIGKGSGPYFYLPKLESHLEARLWNSVFKWSEESLGIPQGSVKATVLIETVLAAFEMEEILFELREHSAGLNAGRWDYIFSIIKKFHSRSFVLPDRAQVTMTAPFMRAYTELLVKTCHRRGAHAIGGMAAFIPSRRDADVNASALAKVTEDKVREANDGFDGTWVAHPDLVPVARKAFDARLGDSPNQLSRQRDDVRAEGARLTTFEVPGGSITEAGLRNNVSVGLQYLASWLRGIGAAAIFNLMEDAATCEISRSQVWQWIQNRAQTKEGHLIDRHLVNTIAMEELAKIRDALGDRSFQEARFPEALELFQEIALSDDYVEFLTIPAYQHLN